MSFTYQFPSEIVFLHTLRELLIAEQRPDLAAPLATAACEFATKGQYSHQRWNEYGASLVIRVPVSAVALFTSAIKLDLLEAGNRVLPPDAGFVFEELIVNPLLIAPTQEDTPLNTGSLVSEGTIVHDNLRFRSRTETRVYDELKKREVLFFPNATAVLGGRGLKREPDFLICKDGAWGILEVMGDSYHTPSNAMQDHDRARLFNDYKILVIQFYDAIRCYNNPDEVADDFLLRLEKAHSGK